MQCPKCQYEPTLSELQSSPDECPSCGVIYAKAKAGKQKESPKDPLSFEKKVIGRVSAGISGARSAVDDARDIRREYETEREAIRRARTPIHGEVTVVDIDLPFWSLVKLMVKLALAAIPTAIIVFLLFSLPPAIISGIESYNRYSR